jgi:hypothetical protein
VIKVGNNTIYYSRKTCSIIQKWHGVLDHKNFRKAIYITLSLIKQYGALFIISDTRNSKKVSVNELDWLISDIDQKLIDEGLKGLVFIITGSGLAKKGIQYYQDNSILDIRVCKNIKEAEKIIDSLNKGDTK